MFKFKTFYFLSLLIFNFQSKDTTTVNKLDEVLVSAVALLQTPVPLATE
jgi:hypothetical protein